MPGNALGLNHNRYGWRDSLEKTNFILQKYLPNSLGFSSFLCVLFVKSLTSHP
jgi:hypothetical protein